MKSLQKLLVPVIVLALVATAVLMLLRGDDRKWVTASFPRTVSVYEGSEVRVLGVTVGKVESVTPKGTAVEVRMWYDAEVDVPADAKALIVAPSVVGDRFIQLTPAYDGGEKLADDANLGLDRTATPLELDEIYQSLDELTVALGPEGANNTEGRTEGALSRLLRTTSENFGGQGEEFNQALKDLGQLTGTLDNNREELFGAAKRLEDFIGTLAANDQTVRQFNDSLAQVSSMLAGEREELAAALRNLGIAMGQVSTFVQENEALLARDIKGLNTVAKILVRQRASLDEVLRLAPVALANLAHTYNPQTGTLDNRANLTAVVGDLQGNPTLVLCNLLGQTSAGAQACNLLQGLAPRAAALSDPGSTPAQTGPYFDPSLGGLAEVTE